MHPSSQYLEKYSVTGCVGKYEVLKKMFKYGKLISGRADTRDWQERHKRRSMTKKRSSEIFGVKIEIFFLKKVIEKFLVREEIFPSPQTRRLAYAV